MEPVFDKVGMRLVSRNMDMGGVGTLQFTLAVGDHYGETDILEWDCCCVLLLETPVARSTVPGTWYSREYQLVSTIHSSASIFNMYELQYIRRRIDYLDPILLDLLSSQKADWSIDLFGR
jgi:hypothetical protein